MNKISWWQEPDEHINAGRNNLLKKENRIRLVSFIMIITALFLVIFSVAFTLLKKDESESAESMTFYSAENNSVDINFGDNNFHVSDMSADRIFTSRNGNTVVTINNNGIMNVFSDGKNCCTVNETANAVVSADGNYVLYIKNAKNSESVFDSELMTGELVYYNVKSNISSIVTDDNGVKAEAVNKYIAISPSGESFAYSCDYKEKDIDKESSSAEFKTIVVKKYGKNKKALPNSNSAVVNISNDGNIIYWYEKNYNEGKDDELVITNLKKNINTPCGKIKSESTRLIYNNDCSQLIITDYISNKTSVYEDGVNLNADFNKCIFSLCGSNSDVISGSLICKNLVKQYYTTEDGSVVYLDKSFKMIVSAEECSDIIVNKNKKKIFFIRDSSLYYTDMSGDNMKHISDDVVRYSFSDFNNNIYVFLKNGNISIFNLKGIQQAVFEDDLSEVKYIICDKVTYLINDKNDIYYIDENNCLKSAYDDIKEEIKSAYINNNILYCICDSTAYSLKYNLDDHTVEVNSVF